MTQKDHADWVSFSQKGDAERGSRAADRCKPRIAVFRVGSEILDMDGSPFQQDPPSDAVSAREKRGVAQLGVPLGIGGGGRNVAIDVAPSHGDSREAGAAKPLRGPANAVEYRLHVRWRTGDELEDAGCCGLSVQRLLQFPGESCHPGVPVGCQGTIGVLGFRLAVGLSCLSRPASLFTQFADSFGVLPHVHPSAGSEASYRLCLVAGRGLTVARCPFSYWNDWAGCNRCLSWVD